MVKILLALLLISVIFPFVQGNSTRLLDKSYSYKRHRKSEKKGSKKYKKCKEKKCNNGYCEYLVGAAGIKAWPICSNRFSFCKSTDKKRAPVKKYRWKHRNYDESYTEPDAYDHGHHYSPHSHYNGKPTPKPVAPAPPSMPKPAPAPAPIPAPMPSPVDPTRMPSISTVTTVAPTEAPTNFPPIISLVSEPPSYIPVISVLTTRPTAVPVGSPEQTVSPTRVSFSNETSGASSGNEESPGDSGTSASTRTPTSSPAAATDMRTSSPASATDLKPPEEVTTKSAAPTKVPVPLPTVSPSANIIQSLETRQVKTETLFFRASGTDDLGASEVVFFEEVERIFAPYASSQIGPMLTKFLLSIVFEHDKLDIVSLGLTGQNTLYRSVFQISTIFDLEGSPDIVSSFGRDEATNILSNLFKDQMLNRLLLALSNRGVRISNIASYDPQEDSSAGSKESQDDINTPTTPDEDESNDPDNKSRSGDGANRNVLLLTLFSGALVVIAMALAIFLNSRRRRRYYHYGEKVAQASRVSGSVMSGQGSTAEKSDGGGSRVQRAALAKKSYDSRDFLRRDATMASGLEPMLTDIENHYFTSPSYEEEEKFEMEPLEPSGRVLPSPKSSTEVAGATLTALDGGGSVGQLNETYPEFEMFVGLKQPASPQSQYDIPPQSPPGQDGQNSPISPYWSVDGGISSGGEDDEYQNDRRRWQDEANDIGLVTASDHSSGDSSSTYKSSSEESEKGWSDESESDDGRRVQVLPSID